MKILILLTAFIRTPDGKAAEPLDVASFATQESCEFVARALNEHPKRQPDAHFVCRVVKMADT